MKASVLLMLVLLAGPSALAQVRPTMPVPQPRPDLPRAQAVRRPPASPQMLIAGQVRRLTAQGPVALAGAKVAVALPTGPVSTRTDSSGKFALLLPQAALAVLPDSIPVVATAANCMPQTHRVKKATRALVSFSLYSVESVMESAHITLPIPGPPTPHEGHEHARATTSAFWPPPQCSTLARLDSRYFAQAQTLADVDDILSDALNAATYDDLRYYAAPDGFVLITRLEQTNADGVALPGKERWSVEVPADVGSSFASYLRALFIPASGHFRVIAFAVTTQPIAQYRPAPQESEARQWLQQGADELDPSVGALLYGPQYHCTALIYEFKQSADHPSPLVVPGELDAKTHLAKSRIMAGLPKLTP